MRIYIIILCFIISGSLLAEENQVGRYQLVPAKIVDASKGNATDELFKIDTVTGDTWIFDRTIAKLDNGEPYGLEGWRKMTSFPEALDEYYSFKTNSVKQKVRSQYRKVLRETENK